MQINTPISVATTPSIHAAHVAPNEKAVAITFDDGSEATITALDVLRLQNKQSRIETR